MKKWLGIGIATLVTLPWFLILFLGLPLSPIPEAAISGLAIIGAAFLLSWGAEVAQLEIPRALAVAFVAIVGILPEYAVDIYIAGKAGRDPTYIPFAIANMTGANRIIIGVAWAMVAFVWWARSKKTAVKIDKGHGFEFSILLLVTLYSFIIPFKRTLSLFDGFVLVGFFVYYMWQASRGKMEEPKLEEGPLTSIAALPRGQRRLIISTLFLWCFATIALAAKPFTEGLIASGRIFHIEQFLLIQVLAPIATEAPEFIVAGMLAFRGNASLAIGALLSSKINQWTLLVGMVPIVYSASLHAGGLALHPLPLDGRQVEEMLLTSAQSLFAVAILADFDLGLPDAGALFFLYVTQYFFPSPHVRFYYVGIYFVLAAGVFFFKRKNREEITKHFGMLRRRKD